MVEAARTWSQPRSSAAKTLQRRCRGKVTSRLCRGALRRLRLGLPRLSFGPSIVRCGVPARPCVRLRPVLVGAPIVGYVWDSLGVPFGPSVRRCGVPFASSRASCPTPSTTATTSRRTKTARAPPGHRMSRSNRGRLKATSVKTGWLTVSQQSRPSPPSSFYIYKLSS